MTLNLKLSKLSPPQIISAGSFAGFLLVIIVTWLASQQPWLGIQIKYQVGSSTLKVAKVLKDSPAYNIIEAGDEIIGFQYNNKYVPVSYFLNIEDPDSLPTYGLFNTFMDKQTEVYELLKREQLIIKLKHKNVIVHPKNTRPISSIPITSYWMIIAFGYIALIIVLSIWSFRRNLFHIKILTILGAGFFFGATFNAITLSREIVLHGELFYKLSSLNLLGIILFSLSITALLWNYPKKLSDFPTTQIIYGFYPLIWINQTWQIIELPIHAYYLHFLITFVFLVFFAIRQWYQTRDSLVDQTAIYWFLLSITLSLGTTFTFFYIPSIYSTQSYIPVSGAYFSAFMIFLGISLGIIKFRLFDISRVWLEIWVWLISGTIVIIIDLTLIYLLKLTSGIALIISIMIAGWVYFPARQWFATHILNMKSRSIEQYFPVLIEKVITNEPNKSFSDKWKDILNEVYSPINISIIDQLCKKITTINNGMNLLVPSFDNKKTLELAYKDGGKKLYNSQDVILCESLYGLTLHTSNIKKAQLEGAQNERKRIARDLHDDIAAQILTLIHSSENEDIIKKSQQALKSLRETIYSLDSEATIDIQTLFIKLQEIADERIKLAGLKLQYDSITLDTDKTLIPRQQINLQRCFQEIISNIIKHANATHVNVFVSVIKNTLHLEICDDGIGGDMNTWVAGKGLNNIKTRIKEINGTVNWNYNEKSSKNNEQNGCCVSISVPL